MLVPKKRSKMLTTLSVEALPARGRRGVMRSKDSAVYRSPIPAVAKTVVLDDFFKENVKRCTFFICPLYQ
jgi:hypothetical protein